LKQWPIEVKQAEIDPAGREYAEAVTVLETEERKLLHLQQDLDSARRRLAELRFEDADGTATPATAAEAERVVSHIGVIEYQINRKLSVIAGARDRAMTAWNELGPEAAKYPRVETRDEPAPDEDDDDVEWVDITPPDTWEMFGDDIVASKEGGSE
jgi:hypothetical protein